MQVFGSSIHLKPCISFQGRAVQGRNSQVEGSSFLISRHPDGLEIRGQRAYERIPASRKKVAPELHRLGSVQFK